MKQEIGLMWNRVRDWWQGDATAGVGEFWYDSA